MMSDGHDSDACKEEIHRKSLRVERKQRERMDDEWRAANRGSSENREAQQDYNAADVIGDLQRMDEAEEDERLRNIQKEQAMEDQRLQAMEKELEMADRTYKGAEKGPAHRDQVRKKGEHDDGSKKADWHLNRKRKSGDGGSSETAPKRQRNDDTAPVGLEGEAETPTVDTNNELAEQLKAHEDEPDSDVEMDQDEDQDKNDDTSKEESDESDSDTTDDSLSKAGDDEDEEALGSGDDV